MNALSDWPNYSLCYREENYLEIHLLNKWYALFSDAKITYNSSQRKRTRIALSVCVSRMQCIRRQKDVGVVYKLIISCKLGDSQASPRDIDNKNEVIQKKLDRFGHLFHGFPCLWRFHFILYGPSLSTFATDGYGWLPLPSRTKNRH